MCSQDAQISLLAVSVRWDRTTSPAQGRTLINAWALTCVCRPKTDGVHLKADVTLADVCDGKHQRTNTHELQTAGENHAENLF